MLQIGTTYDNETDESTAILIEPALAAAVVRWFLGRIENIKHDYINELYITDDRADVYLESFYDDYCRSCYMGRVTKKHVFPAEVFFSDTDLGHWLKEQEHQEKARKALQAQQEAEAKRLERETRQLEQAAKQLEQDQEEYLRLKALFEVRGAWSSLTAKIHTMKETMARATTLLEQNEPGSQPWYYWASYITTLEKRILGAELADGPPNSILRHKE